MAEADKLNIDSIIARLLEGKIHEGQILLTNLMASHTPLFVKIYSFNFCSFQYVERDLVKTYNSLKPKLKDYV